MRFFKNLFGHQHSSTLPTSGVSFDGPITLRPELILPDGVICAKCGEYTLRSETISVWMPDEESDYHRICGKCSGE